MNSSPTQKKIENQKETSTSGHEHVRGAGAIPSAGKKRDLESGSDSEPVVASDSAALAIVPLTPDDDHGGSVRRSSREHKKPKPYFELASTSLSVPRAKQGLKSGFFNDVQVGSGETSTSGHEHVCGAGAVPSAGKKRDLESGSDSEPVVAGDTDALAIVPLTPDDDHGGSVRRSPREHKKPKPYFELASTSLSVPKAKQGLKSGFFK
ncbi:hypothetical protein ABBQ32_008108 [Trebouxia sp. C0010 RCD-2024]